MSNEFTTTQVQDITGVIAFLAEELISNQADLSTAVRSQTVPVGSYSAKFPYWGQVTAASTLAQGSSASYVGDSATAQVLTIGDPYVAAEFVSDGSVLAGGDAATLRPIAARLAQSILKARNQAIWSLFNGFSKTVGATETALTEDIIWDAIAYLDANGCSGNYTLALTPDVYFGFCKTFGTNANQTASIIRDTALLNGRIPDGTMGLNVMKVTSGITNGSDAYSTDKICGLFDPIAINYAEWRGINVELQRAANKVGWEVVASAHFAVGEGYDGGGVRVIAHVG